MRVLVLALALLAQAAWAAPEPHEVMADPTLQARAMDLYDALRCVQCRSESINSSNADWAQDARGLVRERLLAGDTDQQVLDFFQARYGDYVLMHPPITIYNLGLWLAGPVLLLAGGVMASVFVRRRATAVPKDDGLSVEEEQRLKDILAERD